MHALPVRVTRDTYGDSGRGRCSRLTSPARFVERLQQHEFRIVIAGVFTG